MPAVYNTRTTDKSNDHLVIEQGLNLIQQALSIFNANMTLVTCNQRFIDLFELPNEIIIPGLSFADLNYFLARRGEFGPGDVGLLAAERIERARLFEPHYFERTRPNGQRISVEGHPLESGGWVTIYSDITETWRNEQVLRARSDELSDKLLRRTGQLSETNRALEAANRALQKTKQELLVSEGRMRKITRAMPAHIAYIDEHCIYRFSNNRFSDVMGIQRDSLVDKNITEVFPKKVLAHIQPNLETALQGNTITFSYRVEGIEDDIHSVRTTFSPDIDEEGVTHGVFVQSLNVSAEIAANEMQLRANRLETTAQLTSGLAHDFSNILTVILGNLERIEKAADNSQSDLIRSTEQAARRGTRIIDNLMSFLFRQNLDIKITNLSALLRDLVKLFSASLSSSININLELGDEEIISQVDEGAFQDAILNVLFNARDAIETHHGEGKITVSAKIENTDEDEKKTVCINITDTGHGFSEDVIAKAKEPFFTTKPQGKGTGLGLSMVNTFLEQSAGELELSNTQDGGGQVCLKIPFCTSQNKLNETPTQLKNLSNQLFLIVDDDPELRALMRNHLVTLGIPNIEANGAIEACNLVEQVPEITTVITDIIMPGLENGLDLARKWSVIKPELNILLVSGLPRQDPIIKDAQNEFTLLRKPFDSQVFAKTILGLLS
ncbi:PAS-domain containing protein [Lentilitoribacter sp. Alg239-R112]|uniref:PAS-domain containing protein n=1 Tax=Lentilitoribacter sp. Alg239-R112 TaxID=2305987 RepID=UPI0013A70C2D|nr:PAS-domain containing protein [Lentilitoribacter sp. Alg239-R112]